MNRIRKLLPPSAVALAATALIAGCGGDDGGDEDPAELLETALTQDTNYESGVVNIALNGSLEGETSGSVDASVTGPFQSGGEGAAPEVDLDATATVEAEGIPDVPAGVSLDFSGGFALADDSLFVTYQDTTYEASPDLYSQISPLFDTVSSTTESTADPEAAQGLIDSLSNLENEGTEDVEGEELTHLSGDLDFAALAEDSGTPIPPEIQGVFDNSSLSLDFFVADDDTVRRVDFTFAISEVPEEIAAQGFEAADFTFSVGISDPGAEQTIEAPEATESLDALLRQFGTSEAEILRALQGAFVIPGLGTGIQPGTDVPDVGTPGGAAGDAQVQECIQQAANPDQIIDCLNQQ